MARVHFVKAGDSYYWWKFHFGGKHFSKTHPRPSQLTQSEYLSSAYALLQEQIEDMEIKDDNLEDVADELRSVADEVRTLGQEQEDKIGNMPDSLQDGETAQMMRGRAEACEEVAGELESAADEIEDLIDPDVDVDDPAAAGADQAQSIIDGIGWNFEP
jgi:chromosome segregation ATPase